MCGCVGGGRTLLQKKAIGAPDARAEWGKCVTEFGEMVSEEVKTNPRYNSIREI